MLRVKTYLDKSPINGIGLFAAEFIKKDSLVWDFDGEIDRIFSHNHNNSFIKKYSYMDNGWYILCVDDARFMNHSKEPNTINGSRHETIACRDIQIGEEITCDYFEIDDSAIEKNII